MKFSRLLIYYLAAFSGYSADIPLSKSFEYGSKLNEAFVWQSEGHSIVAAAKFEEGMRSAEKEGESNKKLSAIRQMFVWYRMYGHHLDIMAPPATDWDIIYGEYGGHPLTRKITHSRGLAMPEKDYRRREYLMGLSEILSGLLGVWVIPSPNAKRVSALIAFDGVKRWWGLYQDARYERDVSALELQKISDAVQEAVDN